MKIKKDAKVTVEDFWYDLFEGGYIKPQEILENKEDVDRVVEAINVLKDFESSVEKIAEEM